MAAHSHLPRWRDVECAFQKVSDHPKKQGWATYCCARPGCGRVVATPWGASGIQNATCKGWPRWWELGYWASFALAVIGIDKAGLNALRRLCGFTTPCGCTERIAKLNESAGWLRDRLEVLWRLFTGRA